MKNLQLKPLLKELLRLTILSLPGALILVLTASPAIAGAWGIPLLFILRAWDKAIHENKDIAAKGLLPF